MTKGSDYVTKSTKISPQWSTSNIMIKAAQIRAARALLGVNQTKLSELGSYQRRDCQTNRSRLRNPRRRRDVCGKFKRRSSRPVSNSFGQTKPTGQAFGSNVPHIRTKGKKAGKRSKAG